MIMVISFHYFCLTLIQCSFNVALLNIASDCNHLIKKVISISYIVVATNVSVFKRFSASAHPCNRLGRVSAIRNIIMKSGVTGALINRK
jgi:hypothetical protein